MSQEWTPERVKKLKELCAIGLLGGQIARDLGVSRNTVIGKASRMGFKMHGRPGDQSRPPSVPRPPPTPNPRPAIVKEKPEPVIFIGPLETSTGPGTCQYIDGDTRQPGWSICGNPVYAIGKSWCSEHARLVFQPPQQNRQSPAPDKAEAA